MTMGDMHAQPEDSPDRSVATAAAPDGDPEQAPRTSNYELPSRKNTSLRNMTWALGIMMAVVAIIAVGFFGVGNDLQREVPENSRLDVAASAERAQAEVDFPVAHPALDDGWTARSARLDGADPAAWTIGYTSPAGHLVSLEEQGEVTPQLLSAQIPGSTVQEETTISGAACQVLTGEGESGTQNGIACQGEDFGILVHGTADPEELRTVMEAALTSIG